MNNKPVDSMKDKICMVTGGTSGIGKHTALSLAEKGATVIIVGRNIEKCVRTVKKIRKKSKNDSVEYFIADLSSQRDIHNLVYNFKQKYNSLHVLINNAGARFMKREISADGIEMSFALNHLAYFLLSNLILDVLKASVPSRIINIASGNHDTEIDFDDLNREDSYDGRKSYAQSKLANLLFTYEFARRLQGSGVNVNAVDPGGVATRFNKNNGLGYWMRHLIAHALSGNLKSTKKGSFASVFMASSSEVENITGQFCNNDPSTNYAELVFDNSLSEKLWTMSEKLTGINTDQLL
jgi:NAD(P)-dependent dehydrogenase (short-subunit alcohol dehydrogenase family)